MKTKDVRERFLSFYEKRSHKIIPSSSLVPENDQTTLFTGSGMQPMLPYLLGATHPLGVRIVDSQKCFRAEDIEEIGDNRHTTFFEMLGNWSLGDYFKQEQLPWVFEFLTNPEAGLGLDPKKLFVTVFAGDKENNLEKDVESSELWKKLFREKGIDAKDAYIGTEEEGGRRGMKVGERVFYYGAKKNWWSRSGAPSNMPTGEPGGPDSEIFYEFSDIPHDQKFGQYCHPNCDCGRFLEIGNSVFMQYIKSEDGFKKLPKENVDFGGGLERLSAATLNSNDVFRIDSLWNIIQELEKRGEKNYEDKEAIKSFRIIADHLRGAVFMISDNILPSNTEQGYFVRRLLRRAVRHADLLGISKGSLALIVPTVIECYRDSYPDLDKQKENIIEYIKLEENKFRITLKHGMHEFEKLTEKGSQISGEDAFLLFSSYGFPIELTEEMALERGLSIDRESFDKAFRLHQEESRKGAEKKFKGGLGDTSEMSIKYHTATHLLNAALHSVLGNHIEQRGSNITPDRLRFDFTHGAKLTDKEQHDVEKFVNDAIEKSLAVTLEEMSLSDARSLGAIGVFGDKYSDRVTVYTIGNADAIISQEICGGPHVKNTSDLGTFKIIKEEASSAGVRRIKAILE